MHQAFSAGRSWLVVLGAGVLLVACGPSVHRPPGTYAQSMDSASNSCGRTPSLCKPQLGEQLPTIPTGRTPRPPPPVSGGTPSAALSATAAGKVVRVVIDAALEARIRKALSECADEARSAIMLKHFGDRSPTREECNQVLSINEKGEPFTRAMQLGVEQHQVALACAEQRLQELKPGGFSISPRYRIDPDTGRVQQLPKAQVEDLLSKGRKKELLGTLEPDIVIHAGGPLHIQAVFDFKFPCMNGGQPPWRQYPKGHPYEGLSQRDLYEKVLSEKVFRIIPRQGIVK
jgi:hypothetical protein